MNIWNIRNRAVRAALSWLIAGLAAVAVLIAVPFALVWLAVYGIYEAAAQLWRDHEWRSLAAHWWAAATGKEVA